MSGPHSSSGPDSKRQRTASPAPHRSPTPPSTPAISPVGQQQLDPNLLAQASGAGNDEVVLQVPPEEPQPEAEDPDILSAAQDMMRLMNYYQNLQPVLLDVTFDDQMNLYLNGQSYLLTTFLGEGAFGIVCKAMLSAHQNQPQHRRQEFAIKIYHDWDNALAELQVIERILQYVQHDHIIQIIETIAVNPNAYIVLQLAPIGDLYDQLIVVDNNGVDVWSPMRPVYCRHVMHGVALGIQYLHQIGISHSDVKFTNILIFWNQHSQDLPYHTCRAFYWVPKLTDFSNSVLFEPGAVGWSDWARGTISTAAPECYVVGQLHDAKKTDAYSVGACMLAMLAGEYAFYPGYLQIVTSGTCNTQSNMLKRNINFVQQITAQYDQTIRDILRGLLSPSPVFRVTIDGLLAHEWWQRPVGSPGLEEGTLFL